MKKYLLLTTIGNSDYWKTWVENKNIRNYDIGLIFYEKNIKQSKKEEISNIVDYFWHQPDFKYTGIKKIIENNKFILDYEYIWMPDDDVILHKGIISELFNQAYKRNCWMCQPSILPINYTWDITVNDPVCKYRYVSMVEVMCPMFKGDILKKLYNTFDMSHSGWGLEFIWGELLNYPTDKIIIFDNIIAKHLKPCKPDGGIIYKLLKERYNLTPHEELNNIIKNHTTKKMKFENYKKIM